MPRRAAGILLHPTSLPHGTDIGDLGPGAFEFIDWLAEARQRIWQVLPLGPTGYGNSPYQCFSAFAGNPLLVSLERLADDGLLTDQELRRPVEVHAGSVDFPAVIDHRRSLWPRVLERFEKTAAPRERDRFERFCRDQANWLDDFALFMAVKDAQNMTAWTHWERDIAQRDPEALARWTVRCGREIRLHKLVQHLFFDQWSRVREACQARSIEIMGDLPIFVAHDSADVWARREFFRLDASGHPTVLTGVPPDYFSSTGQRWGNPHYQWDALARSGFAWWIERFRSLLALVDRVRIDHFRGFEASWEVPHDSPTAIQGEWVKGPGALLFEALRSAIQAPHLPFVAENLGVITPEVEALREQFGLPGMAILQFAFGNDPHAPDFRPHNYPRNIVAYTGTHDNDTTAGWWAGTDEYSTRSAGEIEQEREQSRRYLNMNGQEPHWAFVRAVLASVADTAIVPAQDLLGLGSHARMNRPGTLSGNWRWRLAPGQLTHETAQRLAVMTETYERA
jgi:4-alpha-glucanotransferase